jgi:hypothetical protein
VPVDPVNAGKIDADNCDATPRTLYQTVGAAPALVPEPIWIPKLAKPPNSSRNLAAPLAAPISCCDAEVKVIDGAYALIVAGCAPIMYEQLIVLDKFLWSSYKDQPFAVPEAMALDTSATISSRNVWNVEAGKLPVPV